MKGYGRDTAWAGGFNALSQILGQWDQNKREREREDRTRTDRARERQQDTTDLQLREAGAGSRNISDNASLERRAQLTVEAQKQLESERQRLKAEEEARDRALQEGQVAAALEAAGLNPDVPESVKAAIKGGAFKGLKVGDVANLLVTPYSRTAAREDTQAFQRNLAGYKEGLRDGNTKVRPTEKAAFAAKVIDAYEGTGGTHAAGDFWKFLDTLGEGDLDEASRLGITATDYRATQNKRMRERAAAAKKGGKAASGGSGNAYINGGSPAPAKKDSSSSAPRKKEKEKSYKDILLD